MGADSQWSAARVLSAEEGCSPLCPKHQDRVVRDRDLLQPRAQAVDLQDVG